MEGAIRVGAGGGQPGICGVSGSSMNFVPGRPGRFVFAQRRRGAERIRGQTTAAGAIAAAPEFVIPSAGEGSAHVRGLLRPDAARRHAHLARPKSSLPRADPSCRHGGTRDDRVLVGVRWAGASRGVGKIGGRPPRPGQPPPQRILSSRAQPRDLPTQVGFSARTKPAGTHTTPARKARFREQIPHPLRGLRDDNPLCGGN